MNWVNLTPHVVRLIAEDGREVTLEPAPEPARVTVGRSVVGSIAVNGVPIPVTRVTFGEIENLPECTANAHYIVSRVVAEAARDREDLWVVDDLVRDQDGRVVGAQALTRVE